MTSYALTVERRRAFEQRQAAARAAAVERETKSAQRLATVGDARLEQLAIEQRVAALWAQRDAYVERFGPAVDYALEQIDREIYSQRCDWARIGIRIATGFYAPVIDRR